MRRWIFYIGISLVCAPVAGVLATCAVVVVVAIYRLLTSGDVVDAAVGAMVLSLVVGAMLAIGAAEEG